MSKRSKEVVRQPLPASTDRSPLAPDPEKVTELVNAMSAVGEAYCLANGCNMSDVLSAVFTMAHRSAYAVIYETNPPMNVCEQFQVRKTVLGGIERMWNMVAGGGSLSKFDKH